MLDTTVKSHEIVGFHSSTRTGNDSVFTYVRDNKVKFIDNWLIIGDNYSWNGETPFFSLHIFKRVQSKSLNLQSHIKKGGKLLLINIIATTTTTTSSRASINTTTATTTIVLIILTTIFFFFIDRVI